jgi:hypothetical protein
MEIRGKFVNSEGQPLPGEIRFIPAKIWIEEDELTYPTLAPEVALVDGSFVVEVTRTDTMDFPWHYTVVSPLGTWTVHIEDAGPLQLKNLLPKRFA